MPCAACAKKTTTSIKCSVCGRVRDIVHNKELDAVQFAVDSNKRCTKCDSNAWVEV